MRVHHAPQHLQLSAVLVGQPKRHCVQQQNCNVGHDAGPRRGTSVVGPAMLAMRDDVADVCDNDVSQG